MEPILVVDDQHDILNFLKYQFKAKGFESLDADNIESAIETLKQQKLSCIFIDIILGETSSEKILEFIKSEENALNQDIPIIVMSGFIDKDWIDRNKTKVVQILEKPFNEEELESLLSTLETPAALQNESSEVEEDISPEDFDEDHDATPSEEDLMNLL